MSRVVAAGLASAGSLGIVAVLLASAPGSPKVALRTTASATSTVPAAQVPDTVIVIREVPATPPAGAPPSGIDPSATGGAAGAQGPSFDVSQPATGTAPEAVAAPGAGDSSGPTGPQGGPGYQGGAGSVPSSDSAPAAAQPGPVAPSATPAPAPAPQPAPVTASPATTPATTVTRAS